MTLRWLFHVVVPLLFVVGVLLGCAGPAGDATIPEAINRPTPTILTASPAVTSTANSPVVSESVNTPTTSEPTVEQTVLICPSAPKILDLRGNFDILGPSHLSFTEEEVLTVEGWTERQDEPGVTLKRGEYSLATGTSALHGLYLTPLLQNPCPGTCRYEIFSQSPDNQWQLVQIRDGSDEQSGVWLVSQSQTIQLVNFVPFGSTWEWAADGSLLWYVHTEIEYGGSVIMVQLQTPPIVIRPEILMENPLNPTYFYVAFSLLDKTALSVKRSGRRGEPVTEKLYSFDFDQGLSQVEAMETIPGLVKAEWNEATHSYFLIILQKDHLEMRERNGNMTIRLPFSAFEGVLSQEILLLNIPFDNHVLSPSGEHLAITLGGSDVYLFECQTNPTQ